MDLGNLQGMKTMKFKNNMGISNILIAWIILVSFYSCSGEGENTEDGSRPPSSEPSRAISPKKEYTEENPAEWEEVANDHLPEITYDEKESKGNIKVKVLGRKFSERHYIEVIGIMDERGADIDTKYLQRSDKPIAILSLSKKDYDPDKVKVFAKCNLHDLWTAPLIPVSE